MKNLWRRFSTTVDAKLASGQPAGEIAEVIRDTIEASGNRPFRVQTSDIKRDYSS